MVTLWLRRGNDRRLHPRWPRRNKEAASTEGSSTTGAGGGRGSSRYHSRSPTRAMIQLLRGRQQQQQQQQSAAPNYSSAAQAYAERQAESSSESRSDDTRANPEYGSDDSDMSTFDTTTFNNKSKKIDDTLYPILHPTASGCGLEVNYSTTPPRSNNKISIQNNANQNTVANNAAKPRSANVVLNPLRRQLSPLTLGSTRTANSSLEEERQDTATVPDDSVPILPPNVVVSSDTTGLNSQQSQQHPQQVPTLSPHGGSTYSDDAPSSSLPPLPSNISKDTTIKMASLSRIGTLSKSTSGNHVKGKFKMTTTKKQHAPIKHPAPTSSSSPPWLVSELFQRCADCYCMSNNKNNKNRDASTVLLEDMESEEEQPEYFQFLPFGGCLEEEDLAVVVPKICETIATGPQKAKTKALRQLAQLCDRDHDHNRIPLVCSCEQWNNNGNGNTNVVRVLCESVLLEPTTSWKDYRQALLILSNLTLPMENKAVLMLGPMKDTLLPALYQGLRVGHYDNNIGVQGTSSSNLCSSNSSSALSVSTPSQQQQQLEVHLVCAILFNLSFLHDGKSSLLNATVGSATDPAVVSSYYTREASPLDVPTSLLRTLERMMQRFVPYVADNNNKRRQQATGDSVERQALRWTLGMMRNLCQDSDVARVIGQTQIPQLALELLQAADAAQCHKWKNQSMEDLALGMLVELALRENEQEAKYIMAGPEDRPYVRPAVLVPSLYALSCRDYLEPLLQDVGGIHGVRAMAIVKRFDTRHHDDEHSRKQQQQQDVTMVAASTASF